MGGDENVTIYKRLITYYYYYNRYMRHAHRYCRKMCNGYIYSNQYIYYAEIMHNCIYKGNMYLNLLTCFTFVFID